MNCQEALELLYDIIDKEASDIDTQAVHDHLKKCGHCSQIYRIEESVQAFISEKVKAGDSSPRLEALKSKVLENIDRIDQDAKAASRQRPPFFRLSTALALAASLVVVVAAAFFASDLWEHRVEFIPLEEAHWSVADNVDFYQNAAVTSSSVSHINEVLHYNLNQTVNGFQLTGGRMEQVMGNDMAHFVYRNGDHLVSVFVADARLFQIPAEVMTNAITQGDLTLYDHNCRGCRLVYHRIGNAIVVTATTERDIELLEFVPGAGTI